MLAKLVYLVDTNDPINVHVQSIEKRLWLRYGLSLHLLPNMIPHRCTRPLFDDSTTATHLLAAAMSVLSILGGVVHYYHRIGREHLRLLHCPGTLASATTMTSSTPMAQLLEKLQGEGEIKLGLQGKNFSLDASNMKIVMTGEPVTPQP